ncbi:MAG: NusG domain II-containing protein [Bacilli bacterium]|jgi:hypothetical protein|nr:NusG domain II-containing protein [Bacilli bacterium]MCH4210964.1 NusG domain II-containing protein [Bacilli bacterium]MCH4228212.1 NusG domain II-containing protein [Bacilli bacterium]MCH4277434.1 NusG domain II-containing protein [Bacilli bacterium]MCI2054664.1 NusG domain II-containing protein [Bacilli bacterium]
MNAFFKKYIYDFIVVGTAFCLGIGLSIYVAVPKDGGSHQATVKKDNKLLMTLDLTSYSDTPQYIDVDGTDGHMKIGVKKNAVCVSDSDCPHQYCVRQGWVSEANHPIICTYYKVEVVILGTSEADIIL